MWYQISRSPLYRVALAPLQPSLLVGCSCALNENVPGYENAGKVHHPSPYFLKTNLRAHLPYPCDY